MPKTKPTNETQSGHPYTGQTNSTFTNVTSGQSSGSFTTETGVTINVNPGVATLNTLKKVNEVQRIVQRNSSIYTKDLVQSLIEKIRMLQKQRSSYKLN